MNLWVLVCGDRNWTDKGFIRQQLSKLPRGTTIVHGNCYGADKLAGEVAKELGLSVVAVPAKWASYGRAAGPIRNAQVLKDYPDISRVFAFHDSIEKSKGTKDMLLKAKAAGKPFELFRHA